METGKQRKRCPDAQRRQKTLRFYVQIRQDVTRTTPRTREMCNTDAVFRGSDSSQMFPVRHDALKYILQKCKKGLGQDLGAGFIHVALIMTSFSVHF